MYIYAFIIVDYKNMSILKVMRVNLVLCL